MKVTRLATDTQKIETDKKWPGPPTGGWPDLSIKDRILAKCIPEPNTGCWLWEGLPNAAGYGRLNIEGRPTFAHRLSHQEFKGPVPDGLFVLHRCDTPACVNPAHLRVGTKADNSREMKERDRKRGPENPVRGESVGVSKLTEADVRKIRADNRTLKAIAADYGVHFSIIWDVKKRVTWRHV
jgi:hypothetical protein